jgi:hypothetical protein
MSVPYSILRGVLFLYDMICTDLWQILSQVMSCCLPKLPL